MCQTARLFKYSYLYGFVKVFAAGARISAATAYGDFIELAVATAIVVFTCAYVTSDIVILIFHLKPPILFCDDFGRLYKAIDKLPF